MASHRIPTIVKKIDLKYLIKIYIKKIPANKLVTNLSKILNNIINASTNKIILTIITITKGFLL